MKVARNYKIGGTIVVPPDPDPTSIVTKIRFASVPASASAARPFMKYGKKAFLSLDWDDASMGALQGLLILNNSFYTDGCGNNKAFTAAMALNGAYEGTGIPYPYDGVGGTMSKANLSTLINAGWDLMDHGYYHDPVGFGSDMTPLQSTQMMQAFIKSLMNYWVRSKCVPQNYAGHVQAAFDCGYLYSTSQGTFDSFNPVWALNPPGNMADLPTGFWPVRRDFSDGWSSDLSYFKGKVDALMTGAEKFYRIGSHTIDVPAFQELMTYILNTTNDKVMVCTTREIAEYKEMSARPITQSLVGDTLTITHDLTTLDPKNRWRDQCFNILSDKKIISVETEGAESSSFNASTGLVNVFKQKKLW